MHVLYYSYFCTELCCCRRCYPKFYAVQLSFFTWSFDSNLIVVVIMSVIVGLLIALLWGLKLKTQSFWRNRNYKIKWILLSVKMNH
jgi:hypothetical protein